MKSMYEAFKTDGDMETKGIWLDFDAFRIRVARAGGSNKRYQKAMEDRTRPHRKTIQAELMENDQALGIMHEVYADTVVLAWETKNEEGELVSGIEAMDGSIQPFNRDMVVTTFANLPELFTMVQEDAAKSALFRKVLLEEAAGN